MSKVIVVICVGVLFYYVALLLANLAGSFLMWQEDREIKKLKDKTL